MEPAISSNPTSSPATAPPGEQHVLVTILMFVFFLVWTTCFCRSIGSFAIDAFVFVYYTALIHVLLKKRRGDLDQVTWPLILTVTGIVIILAYAAGCLFQIDGRNFYVNVVFAYLCVALAILFERHTIGREVAKCQDASDLV